MSNCELEFGLSVGKWKSIIVLIVIAILVDNSMLFGWLLEQHALGLSANLQ